MLRHLQTVVCFLALALSASAQREAPRIPRQGAQATGGLIGRVTVNSVAETRPEQQSAVAAALVRLHDLRGKDVARTALTGDGVFRMAMVPAGTYRLVIEAPGFKPFEQDNVRITPGEVLIVEIALSPLSGAAPAVPPDRARTGPPGVVTETAASYRELQRRPGETGEGNISYEELPPDDKVFQPRPDRWNIPMPEWDRYDREGEFGWYMGKWWDPFHRNKLKGDKPILGQNTYFNFTGSLVTGLDAKRLYVPSNVASANPGSAPFFGKGGQFFLASTARFSFDLFHGDTSYKPVDWRIRITPAVQINQIWTRERGLVNQDVRKGTDRTDAHIGLQEAFVEVKLADLSPNYDFVSARAGIQQFNSDFRGFVFADEQPGFRIFGNLANNKYEYNAAYFYMLEKNTNSGLNTFQSRHQQVLVANLYKQDFLVHGYTAQVSYLFNKDDADIFYDDNHFLVRPAPIGSVRPHNIRSHYIGITGQGHFGRINVSNAFYQVLGHDDLNLISGRYVDINAQMAALELSLDKDWVRFRSSFFFASGDKNPRDGVARGFDSIVEADTFAGGLFSFFNREGIRLTGTGVGLIAPESFLPNLRSLKNQGQANYVNPGLLLWNVGADFDVTPKLRVITNVNYMRFHHTEPLQLLLFQSNIRNSIGLDYSVGFSYRPPLSDNIVILGGIAALTPGTGLRQIYQSKTLVSGFTVIKFQF